MPTQTGFPCLLSLILNVLHTDPLKRAEERKSTRKTKVAQPCGLNFQFQFQFQFFNLTLLSPRGEINRRGKTTGL